VCACPLCIINLVFEHIYVCIPLCVVRLLKYLHIITYMSSLELRLTLRESVASQGVTSAIFKCMSVCVCV